MNPKYLLCFLLLLIFGTSANARSGGNIYALIVGVSEYANESDNLPYSAKAAAEINDLLKRQTTPDKISLLTDRQATSANILAAAERLFTTTNNDDIVIFYFAGHGYEGGFASHDGWIDYGELKRIFRKTAAKRKIIFADACYSGDMRSPEQEGRSRSINLGNQQVCLFLSSRSDQFSWQTSELESGFFTFYLLAGLRGGADTNRDRIVTARELFDFVNPRVKEHSGGVQVPVMWGRFENRMEILNWNR